jgi:hypothetical protein
LRFRIVVIEPLGRRGMQQEIVVDEVQHKTPIVGRAQPHRPMAAGGCRKSSVKYWIV